MRSRTSRGVPEWSGGEELYIGSQVSATGKVSGVIGIVPGPPEGSRGSTGWGHLSRRAPWAEVGREPVEDINLRVTRQEGPGYSNGHYQKPGAKLEDDGPEMGLRLGYGLRPMVTNVIMVKLVV